MERVHPNLAAFRTKIHYQNSQTQARLYELKVRNFWLRLLVYNYLVNKETF